MDAKTVVRRIPVKGCCGSEWEIVIYSDGTAEEDGEPMYPPRAAQILNDGGATVSVDSCECGECGDL